MAKNNNYKNGYEDGRKGFMSGSADEQYRHGYYNGKQQYDYWNDKNLYPDLKNELDHEPSPSKTAELSDTGVTAGTIFKVAFVWILIWAPFTLFFTWEDWIIQVIFWGGLAATMLTFIVWICSAIKEEREKKGK